MNKVVVLVDGLNAATSVADWLTLAGCSMNEFTRTARLLVVVSGRMAEGGVAADLHDVP